MGWEYPPPDEVERWRPIPGQPGYVISSLGRVRSKARMVRRVIRGKETSYRVRERILKPNRMKKGYLQVMLNDQRYFLVAPLVLLAFVGPKPTPEHEAAHGDGVRDRNYLSNLRWATSKENHADRVRHGTNLSGEQGPSAKLTWAQVDEIRAQPINSALAKTFAASFGVSRSTVMDAAIYRTWKNQNHRQRGP